MDNKKDKPTGFVFKLRQILDNSANHQHISWESDQITFTIHNIKNFQSMVLPNYFRHTRFQSFVRQLNMYDFHKVKNTSPQTLMFSNPFFKKNKIEDDKIARKNLLKNQRKNIRYSDDIRQIGIIQDQTTSIQLQNQNDQKQFPAIPISDLIYELVQQVKKKEFILDSDIQHYIKQLLLSEKYKTISKKSLNFIYECVGITQEKTQFQRVKYSIDEYSNCFLSGSTSCLEFIL